jgi:hypothetical protein
VHIYSHRYEGLLLCEVNINRVINDEKKLKSSNLKSKDIYNVHCNESNTFKSDFVIFTGGLLSAKPFLWEGFCPLCYFHGRAFVRPVIFTGGLLSALSFF